MKDYKRFNAEVVLGEVEKLINKGRRVSVEDTFETLSIFDWWKDHLTLSDLVDMKTFLRTAIDNGFTGYVCFKVGITGCSNGMLAYKEQSQDGYAPDGDVMYRSFTPAYTSWSVKVDGKWIGGETGFKRKIDMLKALKARKENEV